MSQNQPCDVIKMIEEMWERKPLKRIWLIPHFYDVTWLIFKTLCPATLIVTQSQKYPKLIFYYFQMWERREITERC